MPYGYPHDQGDTRGPQSVRLDWKSALTGGMLVMVVAYVGLVAPAWRQVRALEGHVARLAASVEALNESRDGVSRATSLLERLEAQAARLAAAERTLERFETLGDRLVAEADSVEAAGTTMDRIDELHHGIVASGSAISEAEAALADIDALSVRVAATRETARETATSLVAVDAVHGQVTAAMQSLDEAAPTAERLAGMATMLADRADEAALAAVRLDGLVALETGLVKLTGQLHAADSTLLRLTDLAESLADASGTVGQLQRFVVDVMLLEPAIGRAVRALEPVVEFTRAGRRVELKAAESRAATDADETAAARVTPVTEVARAPAEDNG